jgi:hypothetical protein
MPSIPFCPSVVASAPSKLGKKLKVKNFVKSVVKLAWARENGLPWTDRGHGVTTEVSYFIAQGGHLDVLKYARALGCPWWDGASCNLLAPAFQSC